MSARLSHTPGPGRLEKLVSIVGAAIVVVGVVAGVVLMGGCSSAQVRETTVAEIERLDERIDTIDRVLATLESVASHDSPLAVLPDNIEELIGRLLPDAETIGDARGTLAGARDELLAGRARAIDRLAQIDDADSGVSSGLTAGGAILELVSPLLGKYGVLAAALGGVFAAIGRATGVRSGARRVAQNIEQAKAASPDLRKAMAEGPAHDVLRTALSAQPTAVRKAVAGVKTPGAVGPSA